MDVSKISRGKNPPDEVNVIIEVPMGGEPVKYELDKDSGALFVDRILFTPMRYPGNYGFVPHTLSDDGDPIDVLVLNDRPFVPGCVLPCRPIGVLVMEDDAGQDEKVVAVPTSKMTRQYETVKTAADMPEILLKQVEHFFEHYKDLEPGKWVKIHNWGDVEHARKMIREAVERYENDKG